MPAYQNGSGQRADATHTGFDWADPRNRVEIDRHRETLDLLTKIRRLLSVESSSATDGQEAMSIALSRGMDLLVNLPPFPLPGELAPLQLEPLTRAFAFWAAMNVWMTTAQTVTVAYPDPPAGPGPQPVTDVPVAVFRRAMSGVGQ